MATKETKRIKKGLGSFSYNALKRFAMRAGIVRLSKQNLDMFRFIISQYVISVTHAIVQYVQHAHRKTVLPQDVQSAINHVYGKSLYYSKSK